MWMEKYEAALDDLKTYLTTPPLLSKLSQGKDLYIYLSVTDHVVRGVLVKEHECVQSHVYPSQITAAEEEFEQVVSKADVKPWALYTDRASNVNRTVWKAGIRHLGDELRIPPCGGAGVRRSAAECVRDSPPGVSRNFRAETWRGAADGMRQWQKLYVIQYPQSTCDFLEVLLAEHPVEARNKFTHSVSEITSSMLLNVDAFLGLAEINGLGGIAGQSSSWII
ncbi:hypothetical protein AgCh_023886 [Apium graveolens]